MLQLLSLNLDIIHITSSSCICLCVFFLIRWFLTNRQLPPGPYGLPVVGYLPFLDKDLKIACCKLQEKYGDLFSFTLGTRLTVVLGSWDVIKQAFVKHSDIFGGRPSYCLLGEFYNYNNFNVIDGESFVRQKKFLLSSLRDYGFGKLSLEGKIHQEVEAMINLFNEKNGKPMDIQVPFNFIVTNVICSIAFGERFEYNDKRIKKLIEFLGKILVILGEASLVEAFPILRYLPDRCNGLSQMRQMKKELDTFIEEILDEHIRTFDKNNLRDVIDEYLNKMDDIGISSSDKENRAVFSRHNVIQNLVLLFFAATETTATALSWAVAILLNHPEVQEKIQTEIDSIVGRCRLPCWADRHHLSYTEATIQEIHRIASILPINVVHANTEEIYLNGYRIPKRTNILANLLNVHYDPKLWKNPEKFDPTRFLDGNGKVLKPEYLIPFSVGKRMCLGEPLAKMELLIFFAAFLQNFTFRCDGKPPDLTQAISGLIRKPPPFQVIVEPRK